MRADPIPLHALLDVPAGVGPASPWPGTAATPDDQPPVVVVDLDDGPLDDGRLDRSGGRVVAAPPAGVARVVVGLTATDDPEGHRAAPICDVVLGRDDPAVEAVLATVAGHPVAATALALLLRGSEGRGIDDGLHVESAVYSTLQAGFEFAAWRAANPPRRARPAPGGEAVALARRGDRLDITLTRPQVRNALDTTMRDQLVDAFRLVALDPSIAAVHLAGAGPSFCAGGDLDEFGSFPDPATAHLVRLQQSVGRAIDAVAGRVTAHLHGACAGSGIELPAFAATVVAHPSTTVSLPEVRLGLVPGAGGTVSLPRRIGRHRTARLALTGEVLDATTALAWGLVDALADGPAARTPDVEG
jgi:enoyl-CoA hydratase/carnithine racemase